MVYANWEDLRAGAKRRLPRMCFDYVDGAAFSEATARANIADFSAWTLQQRVLVNIAKRDLSTAFLGQRRPLPFIFGPVGFTGLLSPRGEMAVARAAKAAGLPYCLSTFTIAALEGVRKATDGALWFQLYVMQDPAFAETLIARAERAGCEALVLTVNSQLGGVREKDIHNGFRAADQLTPRLALSLLTRPRWCFEMAKLSPIRIGNLEGRPEFGNNVLAQASKLGKQHSATQTWDDARRMRDRWKGKFTIKGILHAEDAANAAAVGADAIVVSNHGGRQLDEAPSTISMLPEIVAAAGDKLDVLVDGGFRRGSQIVKAMALGAKGVMLGRAYAYALAAAGEDGVSRLIELLRGEIDTTLGLMGETRIDALHAKRDAVLRPQ